MIYIPDPLGDVAVFAKWRRKGEYREQW